MKVRRSKEIKEDLGTLHAKKRETLAELGATEKKMLEAQPNGLEFIELDDRIKALKKKLLEFTEQNKALSRELFRALSSEIEEQRSLIEKTHAEIAPRVKAIINELETALALYAEKLNKLNASCAPEDMDPVFIKISAQIRTQPDDFAAYDNALDQAEAPIRTKLAALSGEWHRLRDELKNL